MKHLAQDCPAPLCSNCGKDHHTLICPNEKTEQKLHKAQDDDEDDQESEDEDYYQGGDLFDEDQQFHFSQGPGEDDGDDYEDHYQGSDSEEGESDRDEENLDVEKAMFVKSIGNDSMQESTKKKLVKVSAMEKELRKLQADPEIKKESRKSGTIEPEIKNKSILDIVERPKSVGSNARYESALKALAKQQMLLGKALNTKYTKEYGTT